MDKKIVAHFEKHDKVLHDAYLILVERKEEFQFTQPNSSEDYFIRLVDDIISQQLSVKVANVIFKRFENLMPNNLVTPENVLKAKDDDIRKCGISWAKIKYLKDLAQKVKDKELHLEKLKDMSDEEVISELTKVKGIGRWTAEMFLMFSLGRADIFSHGDLGLKNAIKRLYKLENPTKEEVEAIVIKWTPYRTYACRILWKSLNNEPK